MDLFLLKKLISFMIMPLSIIVFLLLMAIIFFRAKPKLSFTALVSASALLIFTTLPPISDRLMAPLENNYPAFTQSKQALDYIIVLGGVHTTVAGLPATSQLKSSSLERLVEAVRIYRLHPEAQMITSGFTGGDESSNAEKVKQAAILLGVPAHKILTENFPKDTEEEAQLIAPRVINKHVALVTSANHMPRAMAYFEQYGVNAIAAPASPWVKRNNQTPWSYYFPNAKKLQQTTTAWHETLGRIVQWFNR
ncbi:Uncharacterized SAM-binding protein YcdF, DUF218 family [Colwellia chukchiensis]|uniref:Uncharacterized SAM-binding protein YcdF, DUF218 family n=1 Tax=Colwellia chukchiensis TaxID=641665 RepID=A0A1H7M9S7_9GAMM|nr:ElyC/SanA/YdcF family protein [Colwellia chukchiensis]SEL07871.1 Uncharacterized SAM-binding protein YcdF, DUF218 family [Colwellia chukchiensis]